MAGKAMCDLREEHPHLQKQFGCMNGIFQIFDRRFLLNGSRRFPAQYRMALPSAGRHSSDETELNDEEITNWAKDYHGSYSESSASSFSFSSSSSSSGHFSQETARKAQAEAVSFPAVFSACKTNGFQDVVKESIHREKRVITVKPAAYEEGDAKALKLIDSPRPIQRNKMANSSKSSSISKEPERDVLRPQVAQRVVAETKDIAMRDARRFSLDGAEFIGIRQTATRLRELPRFSLDSRIENSKEVLDINRQSSVVLKLMGLEMLPTASSPDSRARESKGYTDHRSPVVRNCNSASPRNPPYSKASKPSMQKVHGKPKPSGEQQRNARSYDEEDKMSVLSDLYKTDNDIKVLKHMIQSMRSPSPNAAQKNVVFVDMTSEDQEGSSRLFSRSARGISNAGHETSSSCSPRSRRKEISDPTGKTSKRNGFTLTRKGNSSKEQTSTKGNTASSNSQAESRNYQRKSKECSPRTLYDGVSSMHSSAEMTAKGSPRMKAAAKPLEMREASKLSDTKTSTQPFENIPSTGVVVDVKLPAKTARKEATSRWRDEKLGLHTAMDLPDQPSPVSVLDAKFYNNEMPSPKRIFSPSASEDGSIDDLDWNTVETSGRSSISASYWRRLGQCQINEDVANYQKLRPEHQYIAEVVMASGLLDAAEPDSSSIPLNPNLFYSLERFIAGEYQEAGGLTKKQIELARNERKLLFDVINEILPRFDRNGYYKPHQKRKGKSLLQYLFDEVDAHLQQPICGLEADIAGIADEELAQLAENWTSGGDEVPDIVLQLERLIFKNLLTDELVM